MRDLEEMRQKVTPEEIEHTRKVLAEERARKAAKRDEPEEAEAEAAATA